MMYAPSDIPASSGPVMVLWDRPSSVQLDLDDDYFIRVRPYRRRDQYRFDGSQRAFYCVGEVPPVPREGARAKRGRDWVSALGAPGSSGACRPALTGGSRRSSGCNGRAAGRG